MDVAGTMLNRDVRAVIDEGESGTVEGPGSLGDWSKFLISSSRACKDPEAGESTECERRI